MAPPHCYGSVNFCLFQTVRLDALGVPVPGAESVYVTEAGVELGISPQVTEGTVIEQKNGCGKSCIRIVQPDKIFQVNLAATFCQWDAELAEMLAGYDLWTREGVTVGAAMPDPSGPDASPTYTEAFSWAVDDEDRAAFGDEEALWRYSFAKATWAQGDATLSNAANPLVWNGKVTKNGNIGTGPWDSLPGPLNGPMGWDLIPVSEAPEALCGYQALAS